MAAPVISISLDVSAESVGSSFPQVILTGSIPIEVPVASEVGAAAVASPVRVLELDTYSSSEVDPSESSPPPVSVAPMVSPFICLDDSELDTKIPERHVLPTSHDAMLTRWRSRVASRSSSPTTSIPEIPTAPILPAPSAIVAPSSEFPLAPVDAPPGIHRRVPILIRPRRTILLVDFNRTHLGWACRAFTVRKSVGPLPYHCLALRYTSHHLDHFNSGSSSHSSSDHSSSGHSISGYSLSVHTPPDTTDIDSSTLHRFVHLSFTEDSMVDSSFKDAGINMKVDVGDDVEDKVEDEVESNERGTMEVRLDMVVGIDIHDAMLMPDLRQRLASAVGTREIASQLVASRERASVSDRTRSLEWENLKVRALLSIERDQNMTITRSGMTPDAIEELINRRVEEALATYEATRNANTLKAESQSQNGSDGKNVNGGNRNGGNGNGGNGNPNENGRDAMQLLACVYSRTS
ncbi:hypothetical protein Tco_1458026 [Tanacetum coccineum]